MKHQSTVLIVDDEPIGRETLEALLIAQGYNLAFASSGAEALAKAAELPPDVILLDVMMPGLNGFDVCRRLRADPLLAKVPVIMLTALDDHDSRLRGLQAGADDFVSKPFDRIELRARVRTITQLNRYRQLLLERAKFEWVVEHSDDGYLIVSEGDDVLYANPLARRYLNLPADKDEPNSQTFLEWVRKWYHCEPQEAWAIWPERPAGESPRYLVRPESPTTDAFWLQVDVMEMTLSASGEYLVRLRDITASMITHRAMWTFHAQINHKLRTPLAHLTGYLGILQEDGSTFSDAERESLLGTARRNAIQLQDAILDIFQYIEAPEMVRPGHGRCALAEVWAALSGNSAGSELRLGHLACDAVDDLDRSYVPMSRQAIELIVWELLENAKKFHPTQSPTLDIRMSGISDGIRIQIRDDGQTLSPDQLAKIWIPYYQAERRHTGQVPGMGLGLSMAASLIWEVGGTCRAYNRDDGPGVVVELVLPVEKNK